MYKQAIVVRKDLKLGKGKLSAHASHAAVGSVFLCSEHVIEAWRGEGEKKVVLKIENLEKLREIYKKAKKAKIPCFLVKDAGLTQLKRGTITCIGIGPDEEKNIDKITGKLKLL